MSARPWAVLLVCLSACENGAGDSPQPLPLASGDTSDGGFGTGKRLDAPVQHFGGDGGGIPAQVHIAIVSPTSGAILKAVSAPEVRARITTTTPADASPVADQINVVTYALSRVGDAKAVALVKGSLFGPGDNAEFATRTDLTTLATGDYILTVSAVTMNGGVGTANTTVRVDAGPTIRMVSPRANGTYKGNATVQVQVDSAPFDPTVEPIEASVGGYPIALARSAPGIYEGTINFNAYTPPLVDEQSITVGATNSQGTHNQVEVKFTIDVHGPVFSNTTPLPGEVVGGVITVRAKVDDISGVLSPSVIAIIGDKIDNNFRLQLKPEAGAPGYYSALFDTAKLTACKPAPSTELCIVLPNLSFRASDGLGNDSFMAYDFAVDNIAPIFDLNPTDMRLLKRDKGRVFCSWSFDPLRRYGYLGDMPHAGCAVPQIFDLRARIEDQGNHGDGLKLVPIAGIDPATTHMYVLDDTSQALAVDTDGDTYCDSINPLLLPTTSPPINSRQVMTVRLVGVPPKGSANFTPDPSLTASEAAAYGCGPGTDTSPPDFLCIDQLSTVAIGYPAARSPQSAIWTIEPLTGDWCMGGQFDTYANHIDDGWVCFAAAGADRNGNKSVSAPLAVWVQKSGLAAYCPAPPPTAGSAPNCTGTYDAATKTVSAQPCISRGFPAKEARWQDP